MTQERQAGLEPWIVWSNEHRAFWAPNRQGYTKAIEKAGRYSRDEAENICRYAAPRANSTINVGTPPEICMPAPEATPEGALLNEARGVLLYYADTFCEHPGNEGCGKFDELVCSGCKARAAIAKAGGAS